MAVDALRAHKKRQAGERLAAGAEWSDQDLVFCTRTGGALDAANVRREFRAVCKTAQIGEHWTPRELRHSFVSLMSSSGVPVEEIAGSGALEHEDHRGGLQARTAADPDDRRRGHGQAFQPPCVLTFVRRGRRSR
jgi:site-specific recombinase XerD